MKIDLSKNKKSNIGDQNKKEGPVEKLIGKPTQKDDGKSPIQQAIEEKVPFIAVLTERFSLKTIAIGAGVILFILIALIGRMFGGGGEDYIDDLDMIPQEEIGDVVETEAEQPTDEGSPEEEVSEEPVETEEPEEEDVSEVTMEDVKANLLNPDKDIEDPTDAQNVVLEGLKHLEMLASENGMYQPKENQAMGTTDTTIANDIILAMQAGYKVDMENSEWTQGSKDFVYQFVIPIHSDGAPNGFLSGNYRTDTNDFQVVRLEGVDYSALASPGGGEGFSQAPSEEELNEE